VNWFYQRVRFSVLSSGSKANCTYVEVDGIRFLIDCGLSGKQCELRLAEVGVDPSSLDYIFVTHEHHDHVHGVPTLSKRYGLPVFANAATMAALPKVSKREIFRTGEKFYPHGAVAVTPFSINHDAVDPVGFVFEGAGFKFVHVTDLGRVTPTVLEHVRGAHALVLESNHDQEMLQTCSYSWDLKQRIASTHGHLCNDAAGQLLADVLHPELFHVVLGHLSENSNTPNAALESAHSYLNRCGDRANTLRTLLCGSVYKSLPLLELDEPHHLGVVIGA
jgi:phosphoribosyl 1,2-cyclic phosphodiesterase